MMISSNLTNKYNPQELSFKSYLTSNSSNLTNKYNPQEPIPKGKKCYYVQILPINTILKNNQAQRKPCNDVQILPINTILKNQLQTV